MTVVTDASFAPGGDKSRTGYCVFLNGRLVHWGSTKQQVTAMSTCEAELDAAIVGLKQAYGVIHAVHDVMKGRGPKIVMKVDNAAALRQMKFVATNWRNRHFAIRASWIRDEITHRNIDVQYQSGKDLEADGLTKILDRVKLQEMRRKLGLEAIASRT